MIKTHSIVACLVALLTLLVSSATPAAQLLVKIDGNVSPSSPWQGTTALPSTLSTSFVLDTLSASSASYTFYTAPNNPSEPCVGHFEATGVATSNVTLQTDQGALWSASNLSTTIGGDNATGGCPGEFFAAASFSQGSRSFLWEFDPNGISQASLASSADPLATLLLGFQTFPGYTVVTGEWGTLQVSPVTVVITAVPLPSSIVLLAGGLLGFAWYGRRSEYANGRDRT